MSNELISEKGVNADTLISVFELFSIPASVADDGDLYILFRGRSIRLECLIYPSCLCYTIWIPMRADLDLTTALMIVNKLNLGLNFGRFHIHDSSPNMLIADYYLPYVDGVITSHTIFSVDNLVSCVDAATKMLAEYGVDL